MASGNPRLARLVELSAMCKKIKPPPPTEKEDEDRDDGPKPLVCDDTPTRSKMFEGGCSKDCAILQHAKSSFYGSDTHCVWKRIDPAPLFAQYRPYDKDVASDSLNTAWDGAFKALRAYLQLATRQLELDDYQITKRREGFEEGYDGIRAVVYSRMAHRFP